MVQDQSTRAKGFSLALSQLITLIKQPPSPARQVPFPKLRNSILDIMAEGRRKNIVHLLFEVGITPIQQHLARHREETGERISLTTYLAKSLACAIDEDRSMHAYRHGKSKLVLFDEVDLAVIMEREIEGAPLPIVHIVRAANRKSIEAIHQEIKAAKIAPLGEHGPMSALEKQFFGLPFLFRKLVWFFIRRDPHLFKQLAGTVGITSMGRYDGGPSTAIPITPMTLTLTIGLIEKKLILEDGQPVERESIQLNLSADHDIIDGAPLVRFIEQFKKKLENGCALAPLPSTH